MSDQWEDDCWGASRLFSLGGNPFRMLPGPAATPKSDEMDFSWVKPFWTEDDLRDAADFAAAQRARKALDDGKDDGPAPIEGDKA